MRLTAPAGSPVRVADYAVELTMSAQRDLDALDDRLYARIDRKILSLAQNPRPHGCQKLIGYKNQWRVRVGDYRIVYAIDDKIRIVSITRVAHRREVYD